MRSAPVPLVLDISNITILKRYLERYEGYLIFNILYLISDIPI